MSACRHSLVVTFGIAVLLAMTVCRAVPVPWGHEDEQAVRLDRTPTTEIDDDGRLLSVHLVASEAVLAPGEDIQFVVTLANRSDRPSPVFNAGMSGLIDRHAALVLFDAEGRCITDLFDPFGNCRLRGGSQRNGPSHTDWCAIPPKGVYVLRRSFTLERGGVELRPDENGLRLGSACGLSPGRYHVQLIADRRFFSESPRDLPYPECGVDVTSREHAEFLFRLQKLGAGKAAAKTDEEWAQENPPGELVRSNVVTIRLLPRPVEAPKP